MGQSFHKRPHPFCVTHIKGDRLRPGFFLDFLQTLLNGVQGLVPGYGLEIIGSLLSLSQKRGMNPVFMVDILPAGSAFGTEDPFTMRVTLGPFHFYDDPIFHIGIYAAMGMGIANGTDCWPDFHVTPLHRHFACRHPICLKVNICAHDRVSPFNASVFPMLYGPKGNALFPSYRPIRPDRHQLPFDYGPPLAVRLQLFFVHSLEQ